MRALLFVLLLAGAGAQASECPPLLDAALPTLTDERPAPLCQYSGKVLLVVNTASQCGYTPQYAGLEKLYRRYRDRGLVVLGFPSNDFGGQEPGTSKEIARFCEVNYGVSFPMFAKSSVRAAPNPFFEKLAQASGSRPRWNFHKDLARRSSHERLVWRFRGAILTACDTRPREVSAAPSRPRAPR